MQLWDQNLCLLDPRHLVHRPKRGFIRITFSASWLGSVLSKKISLVEPSIHVRIYLSISISVIFMIIYHLVLFLNKGKSLHTYWVSQKNKNIRICIDNTFRCSSTFSLRARSTFLYSSIFSWWMRVPWNNEKWLLASYCRSVLSKNEEVKPVIGDLLV